MDLECLQVQALRLELYDYDAMDADDLIGEAKVAVEDLHDQEEADLWLDIDINSPEKDQGQHKVRQGGQISKKAQIQSGPETMSPLYSCHASLPLAVGG